MAEPLPARAELDRHVPERELQRQITDLADLTGWRWFHVYDSRRSPAGFPDLVLVRRGRLLFFEVKSASGRISRPQAAWLLDLAQVPGVVALAVRPSDWPKVQRLLQGDSPMGKLDPEQLGPAIAILTAWANSNDDVRPSVDVLVSYVAEGIPEHVLVGGLLNLAGILLVRLEKATGSSAPDLMADLARRYMT